MSTALVTTTTTGSLESRNPSSLPPVPWRDVHDVAPENLTAYIAKLEQLCLSIRSRPTSGRRWAWPTPSTSTSISRWTRSKSPGARARELLGAVEVRGAALRLRALNKAEVETRRAADLAQSPMQLAIARKQMTDIRTLKHTAVRNVEFTKPLTVPALVFSAGIVLMFVVMLWK
jgi:hypothetical protein